MSHLYLRLPTVCMETDGTDTSQTQITELAKARTIDISLGNI